MAPGCGSGGDPEDALIGTVFDAYATSTIDFVLAPAGGEA